MEACTIFFTLFPLPGGAKIRCFSRSGPKILHVVGWVVNDNNVGKCAKKEGRDDKHWLLLYFLRPSP